MQNALGPPWDPFGLLQTPWDPFGIPFGTQWLEFDRVNPSVWVGLVSKPVLCLVLNSVSGLPGRLADHARDAEEV